MGMFDAVRNVYSHYFALEGRATRSEFWWFQLYLWLAYLALAAIGFVVCDVLKMEEEIPLALMALFVLFNLIPSFTLFVRRLHDSTKSGLWLFLIFFHGPGVLVLFIFTLLNSDGDNKYGPAVKNEDDEDDIQYL